MGKFFDSLKRYADTITVAGINSVPAREIRNEMETYEDFDDLADLMDGLIKKCPKQQDEFSVAQQYIVALAASGSEGEAVRNVRNAMADSRRFREFARLADPMVDRSRFVSSLIRYIEAVASCGPMGEDAATERRRSEHLYGFTTYANMIDALANRTDNRADLLDLIGEYMTAVAHDGTDGIWAHTIRQRHFLTPGFKECAAAINRFRAGNTNIDWPLAMTRTSSTPPPNPEAPSPRDESWGKSLLEAITNYLEVVYEHGPDDKDIRQLRSDLSNVSRFDQYAAIIDDLASRGWSGGNDNEEDEEEDDTNLDAAPQPSHEEDVIGLLTAAAIKAEIIGTGTKSARHMLLATWLYLIAELHRADSLRDYDRYFRKMLYPHVFKVFRERLSQ